MMPLAKIYSPGFYLSFDELCLSANISKQSLMELIEHNIVTPFTEPQSLQSRFHVACVMQAKKAVRLYRDLEIDWSDLALVLTLLDEIERLKSENFQLKQQLERFFTKA